VLGTLTLDVEMPGESITLARVADRQGLTQDRYWSGSSDRLPGVFELGFAFNAWSCPMISSGWALIAEQARATARLQPARATRAHQRKQIEEAQPHHLRHADRRGRAAPQG
jgi:hypothetical protein